MINEKHALIVVGGGAGGMMAAIAAAQHGAEVLLLEKNNRCGKKIRITGKGRCNLTTSKPRQDILAHVRYNEKFLYSPLAAFDNQALMSFFESRGCALKIERGDRVFPTSDHAQDIIDVLVREMRTLGVRVHYDAAVRRIMPLSDGGYRMVTDQDQCYEAQAVILATGGHSYPATGSTGDGDKFALSLGIPIKPARPALVPLVAKENWVTTLQGVSLRNVGFRVRDDKKKVLYQDFGELLFTHFGISGPVVLSASGHCADYWLQQRSPLRVEIDLKPALQEDQLDRRLLREIDAHHNKQLVNVMPVLLPKRMVDAFIARCEIPPTRVMHQLSKKERRRIVETLKCFAFDVRSTRPMAEGIVTAGGIDVKALSSKTMAVKARPGLYCCGEMIDVDAYTGGFNLQIAFSTGFLAGREAARDVTGQKEAPCK